MLEAQILLRNSPMAIKEIAYELGFNEQSLFSKYFSRVSGSYPESYRRSSTAKSIRLDRTVLVYFLDFQ